LAIQVPSVGTPAIAGYADDVANQLNQQRDFMTLTNQTATTTGSGTATWVTMGNVTVPTWASKGRIQLNITGLAGSTTTAAVGLAVKIGTSTGVSKRCTAPGTTSRAAWSISDLLTAVPTGSQSVTIVATFISGTFSVAADANFDLNIDWLA
jgi:hypothetical protein